MNDNFKMAILAIVILAGVFLIMNAKDSSPNLGYVGPANIFDAPGIANSSVSITVTASSTTILARNDNRKYVQICNASSTDATNNTWIWFNTSTDSVAIDKGFTLAAGSCYEIDSTNLYIGPIYAIATATTVIISTLEQ